LFGPSFIRILLRSHAFLFDDPDGGGLAEGQVAQSQRLPKHLHVPNPPH
jgi:hypothetical protein